jgi:hypothetical protein
VLNFTNGLFFWAFLPETKGLNLEDMDDLFTNSPLFVPHSHWRPKRVVDVRHGAVLEKGDDVVYEETVEERA